LNVFQLIPKLSFSYDHKEPSGRINQVPAVALHPLMPGWYQFKEKIWNHELSILGFPERKSLLFLVSGGQAGSKFPGKIVFSKNFVLSCPTRKNWALRPGSGWESAASQQVSNAALRPKQVSLPHNLA
jgi:hypothetical protein